MEETNEVVLDLVKKNGPVLPVQISKEIKSDILFASAVLSELVKQKQIFISYGKVGGSPVYYSSGQESKLNLLKEHLPGKEKEAYELLKEKKIIRDITAEPWQRVALRSIQDFAIPIRATIRGKIELFWKWYLASNDEAKTLILEIFKNKQEIPKKTPFEKPQEVPLEKPKEIPTEEKKEVNESLKYNFKDKISSYFSEKNINVVNEEVSKAKDVEMEVDLPSEIGTLRFFVKGVGKKRISDADLSLAYNMGQTKKLPVLFLTEGELTKKAKEYLDKNLKGYLIFRKV
ncbi:hypothetical protein CL621_02200 [archaeon]|nr:hypothetical protein [archaeon]|tara:strand:- start:873 stop:1736 length:864 start_codon:yes stop_codon:yes gene_type:complete